MQLHVIKPFQRIANQGDCCVLNILDKQAKEVDSRTLDLLGRLSSQAVSADGGVYLCHRFVGREEYRLGTVFTDKLEALSGYRGHAPGGFWLSQRKIEAVSRKLTRQPKKDKKFGNKI